MAAGLVLQPIPILEEINSGLDSCKYKLPKQWGLLIESSKLEIDREINPNISGMSSVDNRECYATIPDLSKNAMLGLFLHTNALTLLCILLKKSRMQ